MRLIASPANLDDHDLLSFGKGEAELEERLRQAYAGQIEADSHIPLSIAQQGRLALLTWMIANGRLEVKIALREYSTHFRLFHEKFGIFSDVNGNRISFTGSNNETVSGAVDNAESFDLQQDWLAHTDATRCDLWEARFDTIWNRGLQGVKVWSATEWLHEPLRQYFGEQAPDPSVKIEKPDVDRRAGTDTFANSSLLIPPPPRSLLPELPEDKPLRDYQKNAVNAWLENELSGTFAMATGVGKTITALAAATIAGRILADQQERLLVLVVVPLIDLVDQWQEAAQQFCFNPAVHHSQTSKAEKEKLDRVFHLARTSSLPRVEMVITTAASLTPRAGSSYREHNLQSWLHRYEGNLLVVGDEMHTLGTPSRLAALPPKGNKFQRLLTLGLSATPKKHTDEEGTEALIAYFGKPVAKIDIKDAIALGALVRYRYHPRIVELTQDEADEYARLSKRIAAAASSENEDRYDAAVRARTRLTQHASNKMIELRRVLDEISERRWMLVYTAEGWSPEKAEMRQQYENEEDLKTLSEVLTVLRSEYGMRAEPYTGATQKDQRKRLQKDIANTDIDALVAMKCLDEGIDIPEVRTGIIMASTQNPRQFVQRRGRLLRRHDETGKARATIYDMICQPPPGLQMSESEKTLIGNELGRAYELAEAAENSEIRFTIRHLAIQAGLNPRSFFWMSDETNQEWENIDV